MALSYLLIVMLLNTELIQAKKGGGSSSRGKTSFGSRGGSQSKPSTPNRNTNPYPSGGSYPYPGTGNSNPGGYPRQNPPSYPGVGSNPNQNPARNNPGSYPKQNPAGYPPAAGGYPSNQNPGRGNYPNQYPPAGGYPAGGYPNQYPGRAGTNQGGYPNQYPAAGGYPPGGQYPGAGGYPAAGGYPYQRSPYQYPAAGGYPVRGGNTGQGWGQPGAYPGGYPGGVAGGYPNWNPNNKILSPSYGGGGFGYGGGYGPGMGSPFSRSVQSMGYQPKTSGFAKKALVAAGVGAVAGMAVGYGLGRFPRPHFSFRNPEEEYYYNNYMYRRYGSRSTDEKDFGRDYVYMPPPRAETYDNYMARCMNRTDLLNNKDSASPTTKSPGEGEEDDDTVSIEEIGYPSLIDQLKARRCVELYMVYSEKFLEERKAEQQYQPSHSSPQSHGLMQLSTSLFMLLSSMFLLQ